MKGILLSIVLGANFCALTQAHALDLEAARNNTEIGIRFSIRTNHNGLGFTQQEPDCKKFKNGLFKIVDSKIPTTYIKRQGNKQIETVEGENNSMEFVVKWLDDCTYTLRPTKKTSKLYPALSHSSILTVRIIEVKPDSYIQKSTSNFSDLEVISEVIKLQ